MDLCQSRYIPSTDLWEPNYFGIFFTNDSGLCFLFKEWQNICLLQQSADSPMVISPDLGSSLLPLPTHWAMLLDGSKSYLMVKPDTIIDLQQRKQLSHIPDNLQRKCNELIRPEMYLLEHPFVFGEYCISHKGQCGYSCTKAGKTIWNFNGKAYLYTDIFQWNNRIFFGTAGFGGYFYVLDIDTGKPLASIKTGGTTCIAQMDHLCFISSQSSKKNASTLICVDLRDGRIIKEIELYGGVTKDSRLQLIGSHIHIVTFEYSNGQCQNSIWNTIEV